MNGRIIPISLITLIILVLNFFESNSQVIDKTCKNTLECESLCCVNSKCEENDICQNYKIVTYAVIGGIGVVFILLTLWYLYYTIKEARTNVDKYKKEIEKKKTVGTSSPINE